ncbi:helix-turn-helix domain-containing protein [Flavobacterium sp. GCM10023249]|uniref:helix-turn-helix domain-containing protein n=1 Tax=unclassified Flavobacterium TaxID=196869 RepID=UPI003618160E
MKNLFFTLVFLYLSVPLLAQSASNKTLIDSIKKTLFNDTKKAKKLSYRLLAKSKKTKNLKEQGLAYFYLADLSGAESQIDSVFYFYEKAIQKAVENNDSDLELKFKINKAGYLFNQNDFDSALELYDECLSLAKKNNDSYAYDFIVIQRGNVYFEIEKYDEALSIFKAGLQKQNFDRLSRLGIQLSLSKAFLKLNKPDSSLVYINKGLAVSKKFKYVEYEIFFRDQLATAFIYSKRYKEAENELNKAYLIAEEYGVVGYLRMIRISRAKLYTLQNRSKEAVNLMEELLVNKENVPFSIENSIQIDNILAENYKVLGNSERAAYYFEKYVDDSKKIGQKKIETIDYLHNINVSEIENEKKALSYQKWGLTIALSVLSLLLVVLYFRKKKKEQENQEKFDHLMRRINEFEAGVNVEKETPIEEELHIARNHIADIEETTEEEVSFEATFEGEMEEESIEEMDSEPESYDEEMLASGATGFIIKDEKVNQILDGLVRLEEKKYFLKQECTLHTVAKKLKTNTAYLSKIVNNELGKSFSTYINELRINYIIVELKNNARLRSYSVNAIAVEIGYKRPDAFTRYFKEATGITPTIYIKKINQHLENNK